MQKKIKVLLITPPYHSGVVESAGRWPHLGFIYIAGELEQKGFEVEIYDAMSKFHDYKQIREYILLKEPDFIGVSAFTASINAALNVLKIAREEFPGITTFIGGIHPTFCFKQILEENHDSVDFCIIGEGEITTPLLLELLRENKDISKIEGIAFRINGKIFQTPARKFIDDLDSLHPAWHLVDWRDYPLYFLDNSKVAIVSSSRGCVHSCNFCSQHKFWQGTYRERRPDKFVSEIEYLASQYGINVFFIADEYPTYSRKRWEKILNILVKKKLGVHILMETVAQDILRDQDILHLYRKAGILFIYIGVEATDNKRLEEFKKETSFEDSKKALKLIRDEGMIVESSLILGTPDESQESIEQTLAWAMEYDADFMHFLFLAPWPYSDIYECLKPYIEVSDYSKYNLVEPVIKPVYMTRDELMKAVLNCYKHYYMRKLPEWAAMKGNDLKKTCLIRGMKAIVENSFLKEHMKDLGKMPERLIKLLGKLNS